MGKEEDLNGVFLYFSGYFFGMCVNMKVGEYVGWMGVVFCILLCIFIV